MSDFAAIVDSPLRQIGMRLSGMPAGGLAPRGLNVLTTRCIGHSNVSPVRLGPSGLHAGAPIALPMQWVRRLAIPGYPLLF